MFRLIVSDNYIIVSIIDNGDEFNFRYIHEYREFEEMVTFRNTKTGGVEPTSDASSALAVAAARGEAVRPGWLPATEG